jgi:hypothetical protein
MGRRSLQEVKWIRVEEKNCFLIGDPCWKGVGHDESKRSGSTGSFFALIYRRSSKSEQRGEGQV